MFLSVVVVVIGWDFLLCTKIMKHSDCNCRVPFNAPSNLLNPETHAKELNSDRLEANMSHCWVIHQFNICER